MLPFSHVRLAIDALGAANYAEPRRIDADDKVIGRVARRLGAHGDSGERQVLFARLAVHELIAQPELLAPSRGRDLAALLDGNHRSLFAFAVGRLTKDAQT